MIGKRETSAGKREQAREMGQREGGQGIENEERWTTNKAPFEETENIVRFAALSRPYGDRRISY